MVSLALFAWWELLIIVLCVLWLFVAVIKEIDELAGFICVAFLAICQLLFKIDIWSWVKDNYSKLFVLLIGYFLIGAVWSVFKWFRLVRAELTKYHEVKTKFLQKNKVIVAQSDTRSGGQFVYYQTDTAIPKELKTAWGSALYGFEWPPSPNKYKATLIRWITTWPISFMWAIMEDFFVWLGGKIYSWIGKVYTSISNKMFHEFRKEFGDEKKD